ncbi:MAG: hypothetical protein K2O61_04170 [Bacteroidaceae bacterium]|nr:hypothetical protein [Bacteroidaceae bacterium]
MSIKRFYTWRASTASKSESPTPTDRCPRLRWVDVGDSDFGVFFEG